jgi:hypothetical protein
VALLVQPLVPEDMPAAVIEEPFSVTVSLPEVSM